MRLRFVGLILAGALLLSGPAKALDAGTVKRACRNEITTFCNGVVPGRGRVLACLYAFEDKLSEPCALAVIDAADLLEQAMESLNAVFTDCKEELQKFCADEKAGQGRKLACLDKNEKQVSQRCRSAMDRAP